MTFLVYAPLHIAVSLLLLQTGHAGPDLVDPIHFTPYLLRGNVYGKTCITMCSGCVETALYLSSCDGR